MNRVEAVAGLGVATLVVLGLGYKYRELERVAGTPAPARVQAARTSGLDAAVHSFLAGAREADESEKLPRLGELLAALDGPALADDALDGETAESLAKTVIEAVEGAADRSPEGMELRRRAVALLASRVDSPSSRAWVLRVMEEGPETLREEALSRVGSPRGVRGPAVYAKVRELADRGAIPARLLPQVLRRAGGTKARPVLLALLKSTDSAKLAADCAVALQDYRDPAVLGDVLERMEAMGRLEPGRLPWIGAGLLDSHLKTADGAALRRGLAAMAVRPSLFVLEHAQRGLSGDAETRSAAASALRSAVVAKAVDPALAESLLAALPAEPDPTLKADSR